MKHAHALEEIPLAHGHTTSSVVRIGDTVRRPQPPNASFVNEFLLHLEKFDFNGAPRFLGVDEKGRQTLSFIEGEVPHDLVHFDDSTLEQGALFIRKFHDVSAQFPGLLGQQVICHNDLSPCNFVFRQEPVAIIDFDAAGVGERSWDLAYAIWLWLDLGCDDYSPKEQGQRIELFCQAYGFPSRDILHAIKKRQNFHFHHNARINPHSAQWANECLQWLTKNERNFPKTLR